jgi:hypothetical protein
MKFLIARCIRSRRRSNTAWLGSATKAADKPPVIGPAVTAAQQAEMTKKPTLAGRLAR